MLIMMIIYIAVDGIYDALEGKYDLLVDDRTKEWKTNSGDEMEEVVANTNTFTKGMMMDNDGNGKHDDDDEAKRIKAIFGIVSQDIDRDDDGEDTMHIEIEVSVETVTDAIVIADSGIVIQWEEFTKDVICTSEEIIVSLNYEYGM